VFHVTYQEIIFHFSLSYVYVFTLITLLFLLQLNKCLQGRYSGIFLSLFKVSFQGRISFTGLRFQILELRVLDLINGLLHH